MIEKLEDILHKEKLKEKDKHKGISSWNKKYNTLVNDLGYSDIATANPIKITDWKQRRSLHWEDEMNQWRYFQLGRVKNMLLWAMLYPIALFVLLCLIYIS